MLLLLCLALATGVKAQQRYTVLTYGLSEKESKGLPFKINQAYDSIDIINKSLLYLSALRSKGYAFANIDSINFKNTACAIKFFLGKKVAFHLLMADADAKSLFDVAGLSAKHTLLPDSTKLQADARAVLNYLNDHGHPFASLQLRDVKLEEEKATATMHINRGAYVIFDSIHTIGRYNLNKKYLHNYLEIYPGKAYEHSKVMSLSKKMDELPFILSDSLPSVSFVNEKAIVNLFLKNRTASRFDFIIGVLPVQQNGASAYKLIYDVSGEFTNKFSQGENIQFKFQKLKGDDLQAFVGFNYPYILGTQFGFDGSFDLFQNNGLSSDASGLVGVQYIFTGNNILKFAWNNKTSRLSNVNIDNIRSTGRLPVQLDFTYNGGALSLLYRKLDYRFNPTKGYDISARLNGGARSIIKNLQITEIKSDAVDFSKAYDSLANASFQVTLNVEANNYFAIKRWATIKLGANAGYRYNDGVVLQNEAYRIGGNRLMRGFDELSITTDKYVVGTAEFRVLLEKNSFLSLPFIDVSRVHRIVNGQGEWKTAIGIGMGLNFSTRAGIFNFSFAAGNNFTGSPDFGNTKIHFGYLNLF